MPRARRADAVALEAVREAQHFRKWDMSCICSELLGSGDAVTNGMEDGDVPREVADAAFPWSTLELDSLHIAIKEATLDSTATQVCALLEVSLSSTVLLHIFRNNSVDVVAYDDEQRTSLSCMRSVKRSATGRRRVDLRRWDPAQRAQGIGTSSLAQATAGPRRHGPAAIAQGAVLMAHRVLSRPLDAGLNLIS